MYINQSAQRCRRRSSLKAIVNSNEQLTCRRIRPGEERGGTGHKHPPPSGASRLLCVSQVTQQHSNVGKARRHRAREGRKETQSCSGEAAVGVPTVVELPRRRGATGGGDGRDGAMPLAQRRGPGPKAACGGRWRGGRRAEGRGGHGRGHGSSCVGASTTRAGRWMGRKRKRSDEKQLADSVRRVGFRPLSGPHDAYCRAGAERSASWTWAGGARPVRLRLVQQAPRPGPMQEERDQSSPFGKLGKNQPVLCFLFHFLVLCE